MQNKIVYSMRSATLLYRQMHTLSRIAPHATVFRPSMLVQQPMRSFFGGKKEAEKAQAKADKAAEEAKAKGEDVKPKDDTKPEEKKQATSSDDEAA